MSGSPTTTIVASQGYRGNVLDDASIRSENNETVPRFAVRPCFAARAYSPSRRRSGCGSRSSCTSTARPSDTTALATFPRGSRSGARHPGRRCSSRATTRTSSGSTRSRTPRCCPACTTSATATSTLQGYSKRHCTRGELEALSAHDDLDIVLTHEAPAGVRFERHRRGEGFLSEAAGLDELLLKTRPRVHFFGHHHTRLDAVVVGVRCLGLNKGHCPGGLVAIEMKPGKPGWRLLGEWPPKEPR